jgi:hypothetical protein
MEVRVFLWDKNLEYQRGKTYTEIVSVIHTTKVDWTLTHEAHTEVTQAV